LAIVTLIVLFSVLGKKQPAGQGGIKKPSKLDFFAKGKESGFSNEDIKVLYDLAKRSEIEYPLALFWSNSQLDSCIKTLVNDFIARKVMDVPENEDFLARLFEFREKMEMKRPVNAKGLENSRNMDDFQILQVVVDGFGVFTSKVIKNNPGTFIIEKPNPSTLPARFQWKDQKVQIYFLRKGDASYCFNTVVEDETTTGNIATLCLRHSTAFERNQQRHSIRTKTHRPAMLYPADIGETADTGDKADGHVAKHVQCFLEDLSEKGCSVLVNGTMSSGVHLIVQFLIIDTPISISGVVRSVYYNEMDKTSLLHVQDEFVPQNAKNLIMSLVLGIIEEGTNVAKDTTAVDAAQSTPQVEYDEDIDINLDGDVNCDVNDNGNGN
jgi:hypothetical protein